MMKMKNRGQYQIPEYNMWKRRRLAMGNTPGAADFIKEDYDRLHQISIPEHWLRDDGMFHILPIVTKPVPLPAPPIVKVDAETVQKVEDSLSKTAKDVTDAAAAMTVSLPATAAEEKPSKISPLMIAAGVLALVALSRK